MSKLLNILSFGSILLIWANIFPDYNCYIAIGILISLIRSTISLEIFMVFDRESLEKHILLVDDEGDYRELIKFFTKEFVLSFIQLGIFLILLTEIATVAYVYSSVLSNIMN